MQWVGRWGMRTAGIFARNGNLDSGSLQIWEMKYWVGWLLLLLCCFVSLGLDSLMDFSVFPIQGIFLLALFLFYREREREENTFFFYL